ncbi:MAG: hypothetical protein JNM66_20240 [Bryobacterales bacterium]|nr:hypothetical protein [Bryobacterales bacterium]
MTTPDIIERFRSIGLNPRLLLQLDKAGIIRRTSGGRGRSRTIEYAEDGDSLRDLEFVLVKLKAGQTLEEAQYALASEKTPGVLLATSDPFLAFMASTRFGDSRRVYWGPDAGIALRLLEEQRIGVLVTETTLAPRPGQPPEIAAASQLAAVARAKRVRIVYATADPPPEPEAPGGPSENILRKPIRGKQFEDCVTAALSCAAPTPLEGGARKGDG